jgi:hypothetical protein
MAKSSISTTCCEHFWCEVFVVAGHVASVVASAAFDSSAIAYAAVGLLRVIFVVTKAMYRNSADEKMRGRKFAHGQSIPVQLKCQGEQECDGAKFGIKSNATKEMIGPFESIGGLWRRQACYFAR